MWLPKALIESLQFLSVISPITSITLLAYLMHFEQFQGQNRPCSASFEDRSLQPHIFAPRIASPRSPLKVFLYCFLHPSILPSSNSITMYFLKIFYLGAFPIECSEFDKPSSYPNALFQTEQLKAKFLQMKSYHLKSAQGIP